MNTKHIDFDGLQALEITTSKLRMVLVTGTGPRIAFLGRINSENLFYWNNNELGREGWRLGGGHRVWVTRPGADESEDAYAEDNEVCRVSIATDSITVVSPVHYRLKTSRGITVREVDDQTFEVDSFIENQGPMLYSGGVWSPTCIDPSGGKEIGIPLGDRQLSWDIIKLVIPRTFAGHTSRVNDPQITFNEDFMIVRPTGIETKRMVMAPLGIIAMTWPTKQLSYIKQALFNPQGQYPYGCNLAIYIAPDNFMVEMETYGEEQTLLPGSIMKNTETWKVVDEILDWQHADRMIELMHI
jgi:hypothetical protein